MRILERHRTDASEGNEKFLLALNDGARIESVLYRDDTLCISSQVGCGVRCPFCASGAHGVDRNLTREELEGQVRVVGETLAQEGRAGITKVTVSGAGEPLHNHEAVFDFVRASHARKQPASLTTTGAPIARLPLWLTNSFHNGLTISVHAGTEDVRARLVPKGPTLASLFDVLNAEVPNLPTRREKKLALAYLAIEGENDGDAEVDAFIARVLPLQLRVHLYAHNAVPTSTHRGVSRARYEAMYARMSNAGLRVRMSAQARLEANGGCGTLVALRRNASSA
jgi:23S rRNA (adenine2503-C2)-methyltransferase